MKKILLSLFVLGLVVMTQSQTFAQKYFTYDGDAFSVLLTTDTQNTKIVKVQFASRGAADWTDFKIVDFTNLEETNDGGFLYTCLDGQGKKFTVDYYRNDDKIIVTNVSTGDTWTLPRRDE